MEALQLGAVGEFLMEGAMEGAKEVAKGNGRGEWTWGLYGMEDEAVYGQLVTSGLIRRSVGVGEAEWDNPCSNRSVHLGSEYQL